MKRALTALAAAGFLAVLAGPARREPSRGIRRRRVCPSGSGLVKTSYSIHYTKLYDISFALNTSIGVLFSSKIKLSFFIILSNSYFFLSLSLLFIFSLSKSKLSKVGLLIKSVKYLLRRERILLIVLIFPELYFESIKCIGGISRFRSPYDS